jgi:general secretion pathway protein A
MYLDFFNLRVEPFSTTPDPQFLFKSHVHQEALDRLVAAVTMRRGINAIIGEPGLGKSMLIRTLLQGFTNQVRFAWVFNTNLNSRELIKYICRDFGFTPKGDDLSDLLMELYEFLIRSYQEDIVTILIVDEAQNLKFEALEEIRQLSNLETARNKLLQIILSGQPQLDAYLEEPALHQLKQRISLKATLQRLNETDTRDYILHRMQVAGSRGQDIFTAAAIKKIHEISDGVPRLINQACDNALLSAWQQKIKSIDAILVQELLEQHKVTSAHGRVQTQPVPEPAPRPVVEKNKTPMVRTRTVQVKSAPALVFAEVGDSFGGIDVENL